MSENLATNDESFPASCAEAATTAKRLNHAESMARSRAGIFTAAKFPLLLSVSETDRTRPWLFPRGPVFDKRCPADNASWDFVDPGQPPFLIVPVRREDRLGSGRRFPAFRVRDFPVAQSLPPASNTKPPPAGDSVE